MHDTRELCRYSNHQAAHKQAHEVAHEETHPKADKAAHAAAGRQAAAHELVGTWARGYVHPYRKNGVSVGTSWASVPYLAAHAS